MGTLAAQLGHHLTAARGTESRLALARRNNIADVPLLHIEHGTANPTLARVERLATMYGTELALVDVAVLSAHLDDILEAAGIASKTRRAKTAERIISASTHQETTP